MIDPSDKRAARAATVRKARSGSSNSSSGGLKSLPRLNAGEFAKLCGVSVGLVSTWCDEGMPCKERPARSGAVVQIELAPAIQWVVKRRALKPESALVNVATERAEHLRLKNAKARGDLITVEFFGSVINGMSAGIVQQLTALGARCASGMANITDPVQQKTIIDAEVHAMRKSVGAWIRNLREECSRKAGIEAAVAD